MNNVILMGRLTADPELRRTQSGISACRFTVAVNRRFKNPQGGYDADFISCTAWRQTAEFIHRYFKKGDMICIEGNLRTGSYTDKKHSDVTHYTTEVFVDNVEFCDSKKESSQPGNTAQSLPEQTENSSLDMNEFEEILSDGEVPF